MARRVGGGSGGGAAMVLLSGLSLSVGWGIRGNFGHEFGAMIAGAMSAMAIALLSGREDWRRRVHHFGMFGAIGWSFGGSMSYMQVVAYTHSGHSASVLYGFACLFVLGFLWAAPGGAGTALPAFLDRDRLTGMFAPIAAVFVAWAVEEAWVEPALRAAGASLNWYDTDWVGALGALAGVLALAAARRRVDFGTRLILHLALGWWAGFAVLVLALGLRMTPPRGDNWAGCVGLVGGLLVFLAREGLGPVLRAALVTGFAGGVAFAAAPMLKLVEVTSGYETNWHSVMEQTTGLFNGLAVAAAMLGLRAWAPSLVEAPRTRRWADVFAVAFILLGMTYLNLRKNPLLWVGNATMPAELWGLPTPSWYDAAYALMAVALIVPLARHLSRPIAAIPTTWLGKGQLLYLLFLWWIVVGNFERAIVGFAGQRLVTEGVLQINATICTLLVLLVPSEADEPADALPPPTTLRLRRLAAVGTLVSALAVLADWGIVRAIYGDTFAGHARLHVRFGPGATSETKPPASFRP